MAAPDLDAMSLPQLLELQSAIAEAIAARERSASAPKNKVTHEPD